MKEKSKLKDVIVRNLDDNKELLITSGQVEFVFINDKDELTSFRLPTIKLQKAIEDHCKISFKMDESNVCHSD